MKTKKKAEWIIAHSSSKGPDAYALECLRCGYKQRFACPIPVEIWVAAAKAFLKMHKGCEEKKKQNQTGLTGS